jgi:XTP/dITP diphosphohydrolase
MRLSNEVVFASLNVDKFREFKALLSAYPAIELIPAEARIRNPEKLALAEAYDTYLENAAAKARVANQACHNPTLADDTGLEVDALGGKPGPRSHRYARPAPGALPFSRVEQARANVDLLLSEMKKAGGSRSARFVTVVALNVEGLLLHATGKLEGSIVEAPRGTGGFGYDSVFLPDGSQKTLAEMSEGEKNALSHRARAIQDLMLQIQARGIVLAKP